VAAPAQEAPGDEALREGARRALAAVVAPEAGTSLAIEVTSEERRWDSLLLQPVYEAAFDVRRARGRFSVVVGAAGEVHGWVDPDRFPTEDAALPTAEAALEAAQRALNLADPELSSAEAVPGRAGGVVWRLVVEARERATVEVDPATLRVLSYVRLAGGGRRAAP